MSAPKQDRISKIKDPLQRIVAKRIATICDWFSADIVRDPPRQRLVAQGKATDAAGRHRNAMRKYACGAAVSLCEDVGVPLKHRHGGGKGAKGKPKGQTEIEEFRLLQPATTIQFLTLFRALMKDRSDFGQTIRALYDAMVADARAEARAIEAAGAAVTGAPAAA